MGTGEFMRRLPLVGVRLFGAIVVRGAESE